MLSCGQALGEEHRAFCVDRVDSATQVQHDAAVNQAGVNENACKCIIDEHHHS